MQCHCMNAPDTFVDGPLDYERDPLGTTLIYAGCGPDFCTCTKGKADKEIDTRFVYGGIKSFVA